MNQSVKFSCLVFLSLISISAKAGLSIPAAPLYVDDTGGAPMVMLLMSRDHTLYGEAYNDYTDLDGDGVLDRQYITTPSFKYYGYFNSDRCYSYSTDNNRFEPGDAAVNKTCTASTNGKWSGDFLNYVTTSRLDALRKVIYGGYRSTDSDSEVVLKGSFIPMDAHSWGKSYDKGQGYNIADYTPISDVSSDVVSTYEDATKSDYKEKIFFARVSDGYGTNNSNPPDSHSKLKVLRVKSAGNTQYIWNWVSKERPVSKDRISLNPGKTNTIENCGSAIDNEFNSDASFPKENACNVTTAGKVTDYGVIHEFNTAVKVCVSGKAESNCTDYNGKKKPTGVLQTLGSQDKMLFGLITGTYSNNIKGGVLRAPIQSISNEIDSTTGKVADTSKIIKTLNQIVPVNFSYEKYIYGAKSSFTSGGCGVWGSLVTNSLADYNGWCANWGNPVAEMLEESLRYFAGKNVNSDFIYSGNDGDQSILKELPAPQTWTNPFTGRTCNKAFNLIISDVNPNYDGDNFSNDLPGLGSVSTWTDNMSSRESLESGTSRFTSGNSYFIGKNGTAGDVDGTPSPKALSSLANASGLPQEPSKAGSYHSAGLAYYAHTRGIGDTAGASYRTIDTISVAMSSPIPEIKIDVGGKTVRLFPYARSVAYCVWGVDQEADTWRRCINNGFQPTASIVDFYVTKLTSTEGEFRVSFDDQEQASDYDMDMVALYKYKVRDSGNGNKVVDVTVTTEYSSVALNVHAGYVISGTNKDGVYLDVRDKRYNDSDKDGAKNNVDWRFYMDTPSADDLPYPNNKTGRPGNKSDYAIPGYDSTKKKYDYQGTNKTGQSALGLTQTRTFSPGDSVAGILPSPLWFAAKWGGYTYNTSSESTSTAAITPTQWAKNPLAASSALEPKNYYPVNDPSKLADQLAAALGSISKQTFSGSAVTIASAQYDTDGNATLGNLVYKGVFYPDGWIGDLIAYNQASDGTLTKRWSAAGKLTTPTVASRKVVTFNSTKTSTVALSSLDLTDSRLSSWPVLCPSSVTADPATGCKTQLRQYVLGDRTYEGAGYRARVRASNTSVSTVLGDIINSRPVSAVDNNGNAFVMVAANDGMVHAFNASTGDEIFAYVPSQVLPGLYQLADPSYSHEYLLDGSLSIETVTLDDGSSKVIAVGALGLGKPGLYALDVSDVTNPTILWEIDETNLVSDTGGCAGGTNCSDLGKFYSAPAIKKMADGKWWVIFGNGYNSDEGTLLSKSGNGVIYLVDALKGKGTGAATPIVLNSKYGSGNDVRDAATSTNRSYSNGIAEPFVADWDGDGLGDTIYGGDLFGNLWKWTWDSSSKSWKPALGSVDSPTPIFVATAPASGNSPYDSLRQAITTKPVVGRLGSQTMIMFGTGKYLENRDDENTNQTGANTAAAKTRNITQSIYGIRDYQQWTSQTARGDLQVQSIIAEAADTNGVKKRAISGTQLATDKKGWLLDLWGVTNTVSGTIAKESTNHGERVIANPYLSFSTLLVSSSIPAEDVCSGGGSSWLYRLNPFLGTSLDKLDASQSGWANSSTIEKSDTGLGHGADVLGGVGQGNDTSGTIKKTPVATDSKGRLSWRQLF